MLAPNCALDWEQAHRRHLEKERQLEQLMGRQARGEVCPRQLASLRSEAERLRKSADETFNAVFRFYEN